MSPGPRPAARPSRAPFPAQGRLLWAAGLFGLLCGLAGAPKPLAGQEPYFRLTPAGTVRFSTLATYRTHSSLFADWAEGASDGRSLQLLGNRFSGWVGTNLLPALSGFQDAVREAGVSGYHVRLGHLDSRMERSQVRIPFGIDIGVFDWLTVGASAPVARMETEFGFVFSVDSAGPGTNAGFSPGRAGEINVGSFLTELSGAFDILDSHRARLCAEGPGSQECRNAASRVADGRAFHRALSRMYGAELSPVGWSRAGRALQGRLESFRAAIEAAGGELPGSVPLALAPLTAEQLQELISEPEFGTEGAPLEHWRPGWLLGDIDVRIDGRVLRTGESDAGLRMTLGAGATMRVPASSPEDPGHFLDAAAAPGHWGGSSRIWLDSRWGGAAGASLEAEYGLFFPRDVQARLFDPLYAMPPRKTETTLRRTPGSRLRLDAAPWIRIGMSLTLIGGFRYVRQGQDAYAPSLGTSPEAPDAQALSVREPDYSPEEFGRYTGGSFGEAMAGMVFERAGSGAELAGGRERANPLEVRALYRQVAFGGGGSVPVIRSFEVGIRLFRRIW